MFFRLQWLSALCVSLTLCVGCAGAPSTPTVRPTGAPPSVATETPLVLPSPSLRLSSSPQASAPRSNPTTLPSRVRVFCAGSLMIPFAAIEAAFEAENPDLDVEVEAHGSIQVIRHVTDIHEEIDVVASADHGLLSMLMYNSVNPDTGQPYADWNVRFATNRVALAYGAHSPGADEITADNWAEIISRPGTRVGLSDPRFDALGYRELMILQLAEARYGRRTLFEDVFAGRFTQPIRVVQEADHARILVPEVLELRRNSTVVMRGASIQLIPLLQSGDVDYLFEYESVAQQHNLAHLVLPEALNLGSPAYADDYGRVSVKLDFRRFASVEPVFPGEVIAYGLTIPSNAPNPEGAARFVAFLLGPQGKRIMAENHHPLLDPPRADHHDLLPTSLQPLCAAE